jgi:hypothetical protein
MSRLVPTTLFLRDSWVQIPPPALLVSQQHENVRCQQPICKLDLDPSLGFGELFVGAIIVDIVGNAAEHSSAILLARKGKIGAFNRHSSRLVPRLRFL